MSGNQNEDFANGLKKPYYGTWKMRAGGVELQK